MNSVLICDPTLRDGNHAVAHQLDAEQIALYAAASDTAGVPVIEVGHGNGLGASSLQVGLAKISDEEMLRTARAHIKKSKLGIHVIPGFATVKRHLVPALDLGVDIVRVAAHCTEADTTEQHITYVRSTGKEVYGVLMMSHMATPELLLSEAMKMQSYGAEAVIIMDSAGAYLPDDVSERIGALADGLSVPVGFHGHNNLGMAVANSVAALRAGAVIIDGTARGFGAGAGNTQIEVLIPVLHKLGYETNIDLYAILDAADTAEKHLMPAPPVVSSTSIVSGLAGVFSGFSKHVLRLSAEFGVDPRDVFFELGRRKVVAGQEDVVIEVVQYLAEKGANT